MLLPGTLAFDYPTIRDMAAFVASLDDSSARVSSHRQTAAATTAVVSQQVPILRQRLRRTHLVLVSWMPSSMLAWKTCLRPPHLLMLTGGQRQRVRQAAAIMLPTVAYGVK